jgi:hypothetical protein
MVFFDMTLDVRGHPVNTPMYVCDNLNQQANFIPLLCSVSVKVTAHTLNPQTPLSPILHVAVVHSPQFPLISGDPGLVSPKSVNAVLILINNCSLWAAKLSCEVVMVFI